MRFPDISRWQGDVDFDVLRRNTEYVIFKASQGNFPDPKYTRNRSESNRVGLPFGIYHFYDDSYSPSAQAEMFVAQADGARELWCDWESTYYGRYGNLRDVVAFMQRVEDLTGKQVGMYTGYYWFVDETDPIEHASQFRYLASRPLWLAWYCNGHEPTCLSSVKIPRPWTEMEIWQYGTPAIGYQMGAQSKEIDMNERLGNSPTTSTLVASYDDKLVEYRRI